MEWKWYSCTITKAGPAEDGKIYIELKDSNGAFHHHFTAVDSQKREMLDTALVAMSKGFMVSVCLEHIEEFSPIYRLFVYSPQ